MHFKLDEENNFLNVKQYVVILHFTEPRTYFSRSEKKNDSDDNRDR